MTQIIQKYETQLRGRNGYRYEIQACGRERADGMWEGWLEFLPLDGGERVVSDTETTQPNRDDLVYWATGLTDPYLDGALLRVLTEPPVRTRAAGQETPGRHPAAAPEAVLDPFHVYGEGADVLRGQLSALSTGQLANIVRAYRLSDLPPRELDRLSAPELIAIIMTAVQRNAAA